MSNTSEPEIAVVIPAYNRAATLGRAIESVLGQTRPPTEIVIVDDGSTDATAAVAAAYGPTVRVTTIENSGPAIARNVGVNATSAPWIAFLDSDDYWLPGHLSRIADAIAGTDGAANVYFADTSRPTAERNDASLYELADFTADDPWTLVDDATEWVIRPRQPTMLQSSVFARPAWDAVDGLWPELRSRHDTHVFLRLGIGGTMCAVAGVGCQMTDDDTSGNRQMDAMGTRSRRYWHHTVALYGDVLRRQGDALDTAQRRTLAVRLARGHLSLAKHDLRSHPIDGARHLVAAVRADRRTAFAPVLRRLPGGIRWTR
ncbi:MAG: glycosyltransferase family A protein [Acidimicrobiales bacterium]